MNPLFRGPVVIRPGEKLVDPVALKGKRFSKVDEEGDTVHVAVFSPANCALSGEMGLPAAPFAKCVGFSLLHASTMLVVASPVEMSVGIVSTATSPSVVRRPS